MPDGLLALGRADQAARAAELDAKRKLVEQVYGLQISSNTSVRDFVTEYDEISAQVSALLANLYCAPVEIIEAEFPCRIREFSLTPDSGGAGEFRGGQSFVREYEMLEPAEIVYRADRAIEPPQGLRGGNPAGPSRFVVNPGTPDEQVMPSSARMQLDEGTIFRVNGPGGGGYGDPHRRDPAALENDVAEGFVSAESARRDYG